MGRILAIDYGQKRVGIAVTDEMQIIATPLTTVPAHEIFSFLKDYTGKNNVETIVVGEPKQMNNTASGSVKYIDPFVKRLGKEFTDIKLERIDERFTSLIASQTIRNSGLKKKARQDKSLVDAISATIILQSFLEAKQLKH